MEIVKKWSSCVVSLIAAVLAFALSVCSGMVALTKTPLGSETSTTKAYKVLTDSDLMEQAKALGIESKFTTMKVFSIIMLVVAVLFVFYSIVMLLKNINVIKSESKIFAIAGLILAGLFLISTIGVLVSSNLYASALEGAMAPMIAALTGGMGSLSVEIGMYQPIMLVTGILTALLVSVFEIRNVK